MNKNCFMHYKSRSNCPLIKIYEFPKAESSFDKLFEFKIVQRCENCDAVFVDDIHQKDLDDFYSDIYSKQDYLSELKGLRKNKLIQFNNRFFSQVIYFLQFSRLFQDIFVLEIGPNNQGILPTLKLFQKKINYFYFDQNKSPIIEGYGGVHLGKYYEPGRTKLPKIDLVWMSHSLEHICPDKLNKTLADLKSSLNEGGMIFIEVPKEHENSFYHVPHTIYFTRKFFDTLANKNGFSILSYNEINTEKFKNIKNYPPNFKQKKISHFFYSLQKFVPDFISWIPIALFKALIYKKLISNGPSYLKFDIIRVTLKK